MLVKARSNTGPFYSHCEKILAGHQSPYFLKDSMFFKNRGHQSSYLHKNPVVEPFKTRITEQMSSNYSKSHFLSQITEQMSTNLNGDSPREPLAM